MVASMLKLPLGLRRLRPDWRLVSLMALAALFLSPALKTGYWSEDASHSVGVVGRLVLKQSDTLLGETLENMWGAVKMGRFFPLTPALITVVFYLIRDVVVYKAYLIAVTVLDVMAFYLLVRKLSGNRDFACFAGCTAIALMQFRVFVDPLLAYYGQIQLVTACLFFSLLALQLYLEGRGWGWLGTSATAYFLCTLAYEATYPMFLLHLLLISRGRRGWLARLKPALPFLVVVGLCAMTTMVVRRLYPSDLYVHRTSPDPKVSLLTMANQISAALPLSYFLADPMKIFGHVRGTGQLGRWLAEPWTIGVFLGTLLLSYAGLRPRATKAGLPAGAAPLFVVLGLMLVVLPVPLIAISPVHQMMISLGVGWIVVMIQYFGVGLLLATGIWMRLWRRSGGRLAHYRSALVSVLVAALMGLTYRANTMAADCFSAAPGSPHFCVMAVIHSSAYHAQRLNLESALDAGLMDDVPDGSMLELANTYPLWHDSGHGKFFYAKHTRKSFALAMPTALDHPIDRSSAYRVRDFALGPQSGFVVLSRIGVDETTTGEETRLFVRHPGLHQTELVPAFLVEADPARTAVSPEGPTIVPMSRAVSLVRSGRDWRLFSMQVTDPRLSPDSLRVVFVPASSLGPNQSAASEPIAVNEPGTVRR